MSANDDLYQEVASFIRQSITSVSHLEILLFVFQGRPDEFTSEKVGQLLEKNQSLALRLLMQLHDQGLLDRREIDGASVFRFRGERDDLTSVVQKLADMYSTYRIRIIDLIYSSKADSIREFADAFKFRKD